MPSSAAWPGSPSGAATSEDSFWTWREVMYRFLDRLDPDDVQAHRRAGLRRDAGGRLHGAGRVPLPPSRPGRPPLCRHRRHGRRHRRRRRRDRARPDAAAGALPLRQFRRGAARPRPAALRQRPRRLSAPGRGERGTPSRPLPDARLGLAPHSLRAVATDDLAWLAGSAARLARCISMSPSRCARSRTAWP